MRKAAEEAVNAEIDWDYEGCVSDLSHIKFSGGDEWKRLQEMFGDLVKSDEEFTVSYSRTQCENIRSHYCGRDRTARVWIGDLGRRFPAKYWGCGVIGIGLGRGPKITSTAASIIVHELLGHGWAHLTGRDAFDEGHAVNTENMHHRAMGVIERC